MPEATIHENRNPVVSWRIAIIDDVYAGPNLEAVKSGLADFCADVGADETVLQMLTTRTQCNFESVDGVTSEGIVALYNCRSQMADIADQLDRLFLDFDQRRNEVETIETNLKAHGFSADNIKTFQSVKDLFEGEPFQLVFLDLLLAKGEAESQDIAKEIYKRFKAFILLMSNSPIANPQQIEGFRRHTRLLKGFFDFRAKADLCNGEKFRVQIETLPKDPEVCHAIHNFVMAMEDALGSPIEEPPVSEGETPADAKVDVLSQFMHTLRALGLHDYALLCELTLRNEGHPLGDYMMRLLGSHLLAQLLSHSGLKSAVAALDKLRFSEFLPYHDNQSPSFHRMYADATAESVTGPWEPHPWSIIPRTGLSEAANEVLASDEPAVTGDTAELSASESAADSSESQVESEILSLLGIQDDGQELPYVQLGDLLIKDEKSLVFAVLSASCELQFVPSHVHTDRERLRDDTVLLVPGRLRIVGSPQAKKSQTTAGLVEWNNSFYCIDWFDGKLLGIPHCALRKHFQNRGYQHHRRLQTARALELQQAVLSKLSRIGVEVRPPFPRDIKITLYGRKADQSFVPLGDALAQGGLLFHGRKADERLLVLRKGTYYECLKRIDEFTAAELQTSGIGAVTDALAEANQVFKQYMIGLKRPIVLPNSLDVTHVAMFTRAKKHDKTDRVGIRYGTFLTPPELMGKDSKKIMFCLSAEEE